MQKLAAKVALVTGGSRGIGAAIIRRLACEGADVALTYRLGADEAARVLADVEAAGRAGLAICADSADPRAFRRAVERTAAELGGLDILVNNAGVFIAKPLDDLTLDDFDRTIAVNTRAVFVASQAAARQMGRAGASSRSAATWPNACRGPTSACTASARPRWSA